MIWPAKVNRSTMAAHSRGSVKVLVQEENGSLEAIAYMGRLYSTAYTAAEVASRLGVNDSRTRQRRLGGHDFHDDICAAQLPDRAEKHSTAARIAARRASTLPMATC